MLTPNLEEAKKTLKKYPFPVDIIVEVTAFCNLECIMCPQKSLNREKGEMSLDTFKKIVDEVAIENINARLWLAIMGEPLLLKDKLIEMIQYAKSKGLNSIHLNTNATFLTNDMSDKLINSGVSEIIVGLDAFRKETYDIIRCKGDFNKTVKNVEYFLDQLKKLKKDDLHLIMQFIVMDENEHEVEVFKEKWLSKGAIVKIRPKLGWGNSIQADNLNVPDSDRNFPCPWLVRTVSIHWTGKLAQCDGDFEGNYSPGDINIQSIKEIWETELNKRRERHWANDFTHELCTECKDWQAGRSTFYYPTTKG